jgi:hypothetical protein
VLVPPVVVDAPSAGGSTGWAPGSGGGQSPSVPIPRQTVTRAGDVVDTPRAPNVCCTAIPSSVKSASAVAMRRTTRLSSEGLFISRARR